ncbi:hypothetical protein G7072_18075 [Nocardioides sp. HDW12B]|uniref:sensor histidine kinase n=1 Tax=Nocardioides sp. HDW12B TaxID=2714939 RepID=UPI00140A7410|nr:histidine kinase [Nocardioides sp. HDW12B]QIK67995.1 hypothetical protein G7072_18075 [Nocardioides sp. HDW12B]
MSRRTLAGAALLVLAGALPLLAVALDQDWYLDGPLLVLLAIAGGYAAGAWLPREAAAAGCVGAVGALVLANQLHGATYHPVDDLVFFLAIVGGPAAAGAAVSLRAAQVARLERLQADLTAQQEVEVRAARVEEQVRVEQEVHARLAERIAAIAVLAEGAQRTPDNGVLPVIEGEARGVLDQLRGALGALSTESPPASEDQGAAADASEGAAPGVGVWDVALAAGLGAALAVECAVAPAARGPLWLNAVAAAVVAAPLVVRRSRPLLAVVAFSLAGVLMSAWLTPLPATVTGVALLLVVFYSVGAWCRRWWWVAGWALALAGSVVMDTVAGLDDDADSGDAAWIVVVLTVGAVAVGRVTAGWQERLRRTEVVVGELEVRAGAAVRLARAEERQALASRLHDTVAHAMTVVCLQAAGHQRAGSDPGPALRTIVDAAGTGLAELRDGLDAIETGANPLEGSRIAAVGRRMGVDLEVDSEVGSEVGEPDHPAGPAAGLAFRVVREAVVNVARHAPGASAHVHVRRVGPALEVEVADDGRGGLPVVTGAGRGLTGLRDTVVGGGGRLEWGPRADGGFSVRARIPEETP